MNKTKLQLLVEGHGNVTVKTINGTFHVINEEWDFREELAIRRFDAVRYGSIVSHFIGKGENIHSVGNTLGCDPELFVVSSEGIVPSSLAINSYNERVSSVTEDGFQLELQPGYNTCRQILGSSLASSVVTASQIARSAGLELSFSVGQRVPDKVWKDSPEELKRFGCNPTLNAHDDKKKRVTGLREKFRAGGGHIHISTSNNDKEKAVKVMDILAGNTFVLLDRDEANKERRKNYGRAGEYRDKPYGIEYRVLSNFWLRSYVLYSLAFALVRQSVTIHEKGMSDELISRFDMRKVRKAINENDKDLAMENFLILKEFFKEKFFISRSGLCITNVDKFHQWVSSDNPLSHIPCSTTQEVLDYWNGKLYGGAVGFERFLEELVIS